MGKLDRNDIIGRRFGMLTVMEYVKDVNYKPKYLCKCDCGNERIVDRYSLLNGETKSCGCMRLVDTEEMVGKKYGKLTVIAYEPDAGERWEHYYRCKCECGNERIVLRGNLLSGATQTCGDCTHIVEEGDHMRYFSHKGDSFIFDRQDLPLIEGHRFFVNPGGRVAMKSDSGDVQLTQILLHPGENEYVDHIDGDPTNNRRSNLRVARPYENAWNAALKSSNSSGYKGVYFHKASGKYQVSIRVNGQRIFIGYFDNPEDGARAYDKAARFFHGEFACVNFPLPGEQGCRRNEEREVLSA